MKPLLRTPLVLLACMGFVACRDAGPRPIPDPPAIGFFTLDAIGAPADSFVVADINASGVIVGTAFDGDGFARAFRFVNGAFEFLQIGAAANTRAVAINDSGDVAGNVDGRAAYWDAGEGIPQVFPVQPDGNWPEVRAVDINDDRTVLLERFNGIVPVAWRAWGAIDTIGHGYTGPYAVAINDLDQALWQSCLTGMCTWEIHSEVVPVGTYGACEAPVWGATMIFGTDMNDSADVIGSNRGVHCLWLVSDGGVPLDFYPAHLNNRRWVVGNATALPYADGQTFVWVDHVTYRTEVLFRSEQARDGWEIRQLLRVTDEGWILGTGVKAGQRSVLVLKPEQ